MAHLRPSGERTFFFDWERSKHPHVKSTIDFGSAGTSPNAVSKRKIMQPKKIHKNKKKKGDEKETFLLKWPHTHTTHHTNTRLRSVPTQTRA
jgi:hypothetical protein